MLSEFKEPWKVDEHGAFIRTSDDQDVVEDWGMEPENAARIVACVNACQGIPTEDLVKAAQRENTVVLGNCDSLWKALEQATDIDIVGVKET